MGFFENQLEKIKSKALKEVEALLFENEKIDNFYLAKEDYCATTNNRLIFVDNSITSKKSTVSVPYNKITAVSLKRGGSFSISKEVIVLVGSKEYEIDTYSTEDAIELFKFLAQKTLN